MSQKLNFLKAAAALLVLCLPLCKPAASVGAVTSKNLDYLSEIRSDGYFCWPSNKRPLKVFFQPGDGVPGYKNRFVNCLSSCFDEWANASNGQISWSRVGQPSQADVVVCWTDTVTERAEGTEAGRTKTFASYNTATNCGTIHGAQMLLLTRLPEREFSADELRRAYLHEVGHALGIAGHSKDPNDIMYYAVTEHASPHLDERDRATIDHLYRNLSVRS
jgi:predicted Zn-dependent protease